MAIQTSFLVPRPCVQDSATRQHGASFVWDVVDIAVTFLTLGVFNLLIRLLPILFRVVFILRKVDDDIFNAVERFCVEKVEGVGGGG